MEKQELEFTTRLTREDVAGLIEALIEGLKDGHLKVQKSSEVLELEVPRVVDFKVEAEIDEERAEFEIEVSWLVNRAGSPDTVPEESSGKRPQTKASAASAGKSKAAAKTAAKPAATAKKSGTKAGAAKKSADKAAAPKKPARSKAAADTGEKNPA